LICGRGLKEMEFEEGEILFGGIIWQRRKKKKKQRKKERKNQKKDL